jgi:hypothetical protein
MKRLGMVFLLFTLAALIVVVLGRFPRHLTDVGWPPHAKAHLIGQIGTTVALAIASTGILVGPFRGGKRWAWWCMALIGLAVFGGYWVARVMAEPDAPLRSGDATFAVLSACYLSGLALSGPNFFSEKERHPPLPAVPSRDPERNDK